MHGDELFELGAAVDDPFVFAEEELEESADGPGNDEEDVDQDAGRPDHGGADLQAEARADGLRAAKAREGQRGRRFGRN